MKSNIFGKTGQHYQKRGFGCFSHCKVTVRKMNAKHAIWGKKTIFKGTYLFNVYERVKHQKAKHHKWKKKTT